MIPWEKLSLSVVIVGYVGVVLAEERDAAEATRAVDATLKL